MIVFFLLPLRFLIGPLDVDFLAFARVDDVAETCFSVAAALSYQ